uniref:Uncharacterized protein n=1 Tax=Opuntia streptacantha TaxID=393608 RepID=A0A7C8Z8L7_OPUST
MGTILLRLVPAILAVHPNPTTFLKIQQPPHTITATAASSVEEEGSMRFRVAVAVAVVDLHVLLPYLKPSTTWVRFGVGVGIRGCAWVGPGNWVVIDLMVVMLMVMV